MKGAANPWVFDVTPGEFDREVLERSHEVPVLVDFWAAWCGPCRSLGPVLEGIAEEWGGRFVLAKVDTEAHQDVAARYRVQSIPMVALVQGGEVVGTFVGAQPRGQILRFLRERIPSEADLSVQAARGALGRGDREAAEAALQVALSIEPDHADAHLELARLALADGDREALKAHADAIAPHLAQAEAAASLVALADLADACQGAGGEAALRAKLADAPGDHMARYHLGCCLAVAGRHREALVELLAVIEATRKEPRRHAHQAMLTIFKVHGRADDLVDQFQRKLQIVL
ncbi:MAG: tetratricopeptide repeat protein [Myxococcales bacterium]|nr:tetratricopeptide repeat protein [Myxococcales bacterium]